MRVSLNSRRRSATEFQEGRDGAEIKSAACVHGLRILCNNDKALTETKITDKGPISFSQLTEVRDSRKRLSLLEGRPSRPATQLVEPK